MANTASEAAPKIKDFGACPVTGEAIRKRGRTFSGPGTDSRVKSHLNFRLEHGRWNEAFQPHDPEACEEAVRRAQAAGVDRVTRPSVLFRDDADYAEAGAAG